MKDKINELLEEFNRKKNDLQIAVSYAEIMKCKCDKPTENVLLQMTDTLCHASEIIHLMTEHIIILENKSHENR